MSCFFSPRNLSLLSCAAALAGGALSFSAGVAGGTVGALALAAPFAAAPLAAAAASAPFAASVGDPAASVPVGWKIPNLSSAQFEAHFATPPAGYGDVPFYWWLGDPLTKERLSWQLEKLTQMGTGMTGLQINYAHSDKGGPSFGYSYPSEPPLFSEEWWKLVGWFMQEAKKHGAAVSLSDYTLGIGQNWKWDEAIAKYPEIIGSNLAHSILAPDAPAPANVISDTVINGKRHVVSAVKRNPSIDPMHPKSGAAVVEKFFQPFLDHFPNEGGKGLNFFFSDELNFQIGGLLWNDYFAAEFQRRKNYDVRPELAALFTDIGDRTTKVRLDYYDVLVALSEENYFKPVYDWHQRNGMTYGCDHGGRGGDVIEFGDYWRTQRWNQGPGSDQPGLGKHIIKAKVAASLAHLNERPRVWLEGYYGSGWGTSSEQITDVTFADFLLGYNLLSLHGLYYSTHGGWWEWAPPCNHFRMPYWKHFKPFFDASQRLAYIMTQGHHVCDVAVWYPVAPEQARIDGNTSKNLAFSTVTSLYENGVDSDFIDFQSIEKAEIKNGRLNIAGESYKVLVLAHPRAVRFAMLKKAVEFADAGGIVITLGALPEYSDRLGANDPEVKKLAARLAAKNHFSAAGDAVHAIKNAFAQDVVVHNAPPKRTLYFAHRKIADRDVYGLYNLPVNAELTLRATGSAELWDVWTGKRRPLPVLAQKNGFTKLRLENTRSDLALIVFSNGTPVLENSVAVNGKTSPATASPAKTIALTGDWEIEYAPTLDNSFGDFRWPAKKGQFIQPEARVFEWRADGGAWKKSTYGFGPKFKKLTLSAPLSPAKERALSTAGDAAGSVAGTAWSDYDFSWRFGVEGDPGHQGWHGLKENMYDTFIRLGKFERAGHLNTVRRPETAGNATGKKSGAKNSAKNGKITGRTYYYLWSNILVPKGEKTGVVLTHGLMPSAVYINGEKADLTSPVVQLNEGANPVLLRYDSIGIGYFVVVSQKSKFAEEAVGIPNASDVTFDPHTKWIWNAAGEGPGRLALRKTFYYEPAQNNAAGNVTGSAKKQRSIFLATGDDRYSIWLNGKHIGSGSDWRNINAYDVTDRLRTGENVIAVLTENATGPRGFIGELRLANGHRIATGKTWLTGSETEGWQRVGFNASAWKPAHEISSYAGSLWATHEVGPPLLRSTQNVFDNIQHETTGTLAMRWFDTKKNRLADGVFPFDIYGGKTVRCEYRFAVPPGAKSDGTLTRLAAGGEYGGALFEEPIQFELGKAQMPLGDWSKIAGLETYSGGIKYTKTFHLDSVPTGAGRVILDLGRVVSSAEVFVNGRSAGVRCAAPWRFDITPFLRAGDNRITVEVCNTLGNHYLTIPTMYRGRLESGLIGPVRIEMR
jgi:hypothetical protein